MKPGENTNDQPSDASSHSYYIRLVFFSLLALFGLFLAWGSASRSMGLDFYQFWVVGQSLNHPGVNIYSDEGRRRMGAEFLEKARETANPQLVAIAEHRQQLETYSSPFLYAMFQRLSTGDYVVDLHNYRLLLVACLISSVTILARLLNHSWDIALGALAIFLAWFAPFASDMRVANVNSVQLAAIAAYLSVLRISWRYRDVFGGAILALTMAFKPNIIFIPALLAVSWIVNGRIRRAIECAIGAVVGTAIALAVVAGSFGSLRCWADWISAVRALPSEIISVQAGNFAPTLMLSKWLGVNLAVPVGVVLTGLALVALWLNRPKVPTSGREGDSVTDMLAVCLGCLLMVLIPRLAWMHYYVLMIPVLLATMSLDSLGQSSTPLRYLLFGLTLFGYGFDSLGYLSRMPGPNGQSVLIVVPTLILFGLTFSRALSFNQDRAQKSLPLGAA